MSTIRRQSIISSFIVYFGFALGLLNTWLFTREGGFTREQYGLTATFIALASIMYSVAGVGVTGYIGKFFPYYKSHLPDNKNDQLTWALLMPTAGFLVVILLGLGLKGVVINKIFNNSPELLQYYYWIFPFAFGYTIYMVLEAYAWMHRKAVLSNFLKEVFFRSLITVLIVLTYLEVIENFDVFIGFYAFLYIAIVAVLLIYFYRNNKLHFTFSVSKVTRRFYRKIVTLALFVWSGGLVFNLAGVFDSIIIAAVLPNGMAAVGVFALAQNMSSLIQAPQRAIVSASISPLSHAWKDKDMATIKRIYNRSSINQLIFATMMFSLIWLNFEDGIVTFNIQGAFMEAKWVFFFIGLTRIVDMGTGVTAQIIGTSTLWRFDFITGIILLALSLPLNYVLTRQLGVIGPGIANLLAYTFYNLIRYWFLWTRFNMQPFTWKSLFAILLALAGYYICYLLYDAKQGIEWMVLRSLTFLAIFIPGVLALKLTPDVQPVIAAVAKRLRLRRSS